MVNYLQGGKDTSRSHSAVPSKDRNVIFADQSFRSMKIPAVLLLSILVLIAGCTTVDEYSELKASHQELLTNYADLENVYRKLKADYVSLEIEQESLRKELMSVLTEIEELRTNQLAVIEQSGNPKLEVIWEDYAQKAHVAYDKDDYPVAHAQFKNAISAGCNDGIVWYRYAYSREQLFGLNQETIAAYETAYGFLRVQYQNHRYVQYARNKSERLRSE